MGDVRNAVSTSPENKGQRFFVATAKTARRVAGLATGANVSMKSSLLHVLASNNNTSLELLGLQHSFIDWKSAMFDLEYPIGRDWLASCTALAPFIAEGAVLDVAKFFSLHSSDPVRAGRTFDGLVGVSWRE